MADWVRSIFGGLTRTILRLLYFIHTYFRESQTIPITRRKHFIPISVAQEILIGRRDFKNYMKWLPPNYTILQHDHPYSIWAHSVAERLIRSAIHGCCSSEDTGFTRHFHPTLNWTLVVVDANVVNVLSFPGASIVLYTGLLRICRTEDDLATILAHEIAHLLARHGMERSTMGGWAASLFLRNFLSRDRFNNFVMIPWLHPWFHKAELEADRMALMLMASAGFNPRSAPGLFDLLQSHNGQRRCDFRRFSSHPSGADRGRRLRKFSTMLKAIRIYHAWRIALAVHWE